MHSPLKSHLNCALNVLKYLKGAPGKDIRYKHSDCKNNLNGYSDADWAKCLKTRKSVTALKTKVTLHVDLHCDNISALQLAINPIFHERSKDFEIDVHFIREEIAKYPKDSTFDLVAYIDSDYVGASLDRKSTTGGCQFLGCRLISWQCKKQTVVMNFTTEAEYVAASSCCRQVLWIQN
ncbi:hypothetical protein Tco_0745820 [Tanacetum coccineum]